MSRCLIAGCGYVGEALGVRLAAEGHTVFGLRRRVLDPPAGIEPIEADLGVPASLDALPDAIDTVFYLASPGGAEDALYRSAYVEGQRNLYAALVARGQRPRRVLFASSTAVYGQRDGEWIDESSPTQPVDFRGRRLLEAEALLATTPFIPGVAVRFGGIYGPRRSSLIDSVRAGRAVIRPGAHYTNRIHRDDCVGVLRHLMSLAAPEPLYLGVDSEPADEAVVLRWLAGVLGAPEPRTAAEGAPPRSERRGSKRCRNDRLLASGYVFAHPTFRHGYQAILGEPVRA
jgi:nucleoside-diphosphate-sugar epimerase